MIDGGLHPIRTIKGFDEFVRIIDILEYWRNIPNFFKYYALENGTILRGLRAYFYNRVFNKESNFKKIHCKFYLANNQYSSI